WDGSDDLLRDPGAAAHGVYQIPARPVPPGSYKVRGLWHRPFALHYEFSIYNAGKPAWETADKTGCWLTTHTPPTSMAFVPGRAMADGNPLVFMGAAIAEGGHGLQWVREDGTKAGGQGWVGGNWTGAPTLTVDSSPGAIAGNSCYVGSVWDGELRLTAKTPKLEDKPVLKVQLGNDPRPEEPGDGPAPPVLTGFDGGSKIFVLSGIAAWNGTVVCSMIRQNELLLIDAAAGKITGRIPVENPRGISFDSTGRLLVLSGRQLLRFENPTGATPPASVISTGLDDPRHVICDADGNFCITDRGASHQVKKFSPSGQWIMNIGHPGAPSAGAYDPLHLNSPNGITIDSLGRLWVAEADNFPRRVSVWMADGTFVRAFYGPTEYGGGGVLDPMDATKFFYKGMEFTLDWKNGTDQLARVFARPDPAFEMRDSHYSPDTPLYPDGPTGLRWFTSCYTHNPTGGDNAAFLWVDDGKRARPVAGLGDAESWPLLRKPEFAAAWSGGSPPAKRESDPDKSTAFTWSDRNADGQPQPAEITLTKTFIRGVTVMNDLSFVAARCDGMAARFAPVRPSPDSAPAYDLTTPERLGPAGGDPPSSGGDQALRHDSGWTITTNAPAPFSASGIGGSLLGEARWSYPSVWPGLHASHEAAIPDRPGMVVGHTRLAGGFIDSKCGPLFCMNGNMGNLYLFSADGLFVATLFHDIRLRPQWASPAAIRNMDVTEVSLHDENFWPSITQTPDSKVFLVDGSRTSLVRIDGMESLSRLPDQTLTVTAEDLEKARAWTARSEILRQKNQGSGVMAMPLRSQTPSVDGDLKDWPANTDWAFIDRRGIKANFNSNSRPYEVTAAVTAGGGKLYAAWRTTEKDLLSNSGETPDALFKTGGCLDLMLQTDTEQRLLITLVKGKPRAVLYRQKVPGTERPATFSSPWRSIAIDSVKDVSEKLEFAADGTGNFEISFPLEDLHWTPAVGNSVKADVGVLRGSGGQTTQRIYWSNKATAITADVPSEAELTPKLWGTWNVVPE
ncbi:MAG: repeat containing protein, partial [Verrucomicrobiales bacterium]|nr:repeat containing protein [Verrucomicrobiales bacterium]